MRELASFPLYSEGILLNIEFKHYAIFIAFGYTASLALVFSMERYVACLGCLIKTLYFYRVGADVIYYRPPCDNAHTYRYFS